MDIIAILIPVIVIADHAKKVKKMKKTVLINRFKGY